MPKKQQQLYQQLKAEWDKKLTDSGFVDIESNSTTKAFYRMLKVCRYRHDLRNFFLALDQYLLTAEIHPLHRSILELYSQGIRITEIVKIVKKSRGRVKQIISTHRREILWKD